MTSPSGRARNVACAVADGIVNVWEWEGRLDHRLFYDSFEGVDNGRMQCV
jgi:hypothetical protein